MKKLLFLILLLPFLLQGQEVYNLKKCLNIGLERNYDIRIMQNSQKISDNNSSRENAGYLPSVYLSGGYSGNFNNIDVQRLRVGDAIHYNNALNQNLNAGIYANWTFFDGLKMQTNYEKLKEYQRIGEVRTRIALKVFVSNMAVEYYNYIQQLTQFQNLQYAVKLSKERLRIVEERYTIGSMSRLDLQQAKVDFNADSAKLIKQREILFNSRVNFNRLMGIADVEQPIVLEDTTIINDFVFPDKETEWKLVEQQNASLILAQKEVYLSELDLKAIKSVNYPHLSLNAGYGYNGNYYSLAATKSTGILGASFGLSLQYNIFNGYSQKRLQNNAKIEIENRKLNYDNLLLQIKSDFSNIWMAYENNKELMALNRENVAAAKENFQFAIDRYMLGTLSGIALREAQNSLLEAEQRLVEAEYSTKLCELSLLLISGEMLRLVYE
ncbi:MAG: TolC family protein [Bacteroidales bacterium]|jgi:outer membrane protein TolC|nr:TolC family protein [Bacteroidales bacterium]